jgi:phospholipid transport system substrate-binding protein
MSRFILQPRSFFTILMTCFFMFMSSAFAKPSNENVNEFVTSLSNQVIDILKNNENNLAGRQTGFEAVFKKAADVAKIAQFVAGGAWKTASSEVQKNYIDVYHQYMAYTYAARITKYMNQKVMVGRISDLGNNGFSVNTTLVTPDSNNNMSIIWQLSAVNDVLKVTDLRVENISMALTQRAEFTAYLLANNNSLEGLTNLLQTRLKSLKQ